MSTKPPLTIHAQEVTRDDHSPFSLSSDIEAYCPLAQAADEFAYGGKEAPPAPGHYRGTFKEALTGTHQEYLNSMAQDQKREQWLAQGNALSEKAEEAARPIRESARFYL